MKPCDDCPFASNSTLKITADMAEALLDSSARPCHIGVGRGNCEGQRIFKTAEARGIIKRPHKVFTNKAEFRKARIG